MICEKCGKELNGLNYCPNCKLKEERKRIKEQDIINKSNEEVTVIENKTIKFSVTSDFIVFIKICLIGNFFLGICFFVVVGNPNFNPLYSHEDIWFFCFYPIFAIIAGIMTGIGDVNHKNFYWSINIVLMIIPLWFLIFVQLVDSDKTNMDMNVVFQSVLIISFLFFIITFFLSAISHAFTKVIKILTEK